MGILGYNNSAVCINNRKHRCFHLYFRISYDIMYTYHFFEITEVCYLYLYLSCVVLRFICLFIYLKGIVTQRGNTEEEVEINPLVHSPDAHSSQGWAVLKPGRQELHSSFPCGW